MEQKETIRYHGRLNCELIQKEFLAVVNHLYTNNENLTIFFIDFISPKHQKITIFVKKDQNFNQFPFVMENRIPCYEGKPGYSYWLIPMLYNSAINQQGRNVTANHMHSKSGHGINVFWDSKEFSMTWDRKKWGFLLWDTILLNRTNHFDVEIISNDTIMVACRQQIAIFQAKLVKITDENNTIVEKIEFEILRKFNISNMDNHEISQISFGFEFCKPCIYFTAEGSIHILYMI